MIEQEEMTGAEILNEIARMCITKIKAENLELNNNWYGLFCGIENEIKRTRRLLNNINHIEKNKDQKVEF